MKRYLYDTTYNSISAVIEPPDDHGDTNDMPEPSNWELVTVLPTGKRLIGEDVDEYVFVWKKTVEVEG